MTRGRNIASERVRIGMTQPQLAKAIGVTTGTVSNWELGKFEPTGKKLDRMAKLFGCSVDYILGMTDERIPVHPGRPGTGG